VIDRQRLLPAAMRRPSHRQHPEQHQYAAPLLPASARRLAAMLGVGCLVLVAVLGVISARQSHGDAIDRPVDSWITGLRINSSTLELISRPGGATASVVLAAALALLCLAMRRVGGAVLAVAGLALASLLTERVLKPGVDRTITVHHYLTYPSGHTTAMFALSTALAVVLLGVRGRPAVRVAVVVAAVLVSCVVGMAMIGLGFHYFTDAVAGAAVGTGVVIGMAFLLDLPVARRRLRWPGR
jgi:membrane-associated phospholipid phosphatase